MSFNHVAITTKNLLATHRFYTDALGFTLAKVDEALPRQHILIFRVAPTM